MASSQPDRSPHGTAQCSDSDRAFALRELCACWNQAFEAMGQGDLDRVGSLMDVADQQAAAAGNGDGDSSDEQELRRAATVAFGRLQHAMQAGMTGIREEMARARKGQKALRGYGADRGDARVRASV